MEREPESFDKRVTRLEFQMEYISKRLDSIDDNTKWIRRTFTGGIVAAILSGVGSYIFWLVTT